MKQWYALYVFLYSYGLVQDCSNSNGLAMELLPSCTKPSINSSSATTSQESINHFEWFNLSSENEFNFFISPWNFENLSYGIL